MIKSLKIGLEPVAWLS